MKNNFENKVFCLKNFSHRFLKISWESYAKKMCVDCGWVKSIRIWILPNDIDYIIFFYASEILFFLKNGDDPFN